MLQSSLLTPLNPSAARSTLTPALADASGARADFSRFVQRVRRRYPAELGLLAPGLPLHDEIGALIAQLRADGRALPSALRVARHLVLERLAVLDVEQAAPMEDVTRSMSALAEVALDLALAAAFAAEDARCGVPRNARGERIEFWVVGMGKLGGRELNVSSDIDLVYVYEEDGVTDSVATGDRAGVNACTAHEYFSQVAKSLFTLIGETTDDGFVFRVDLALRPNGKSGPPVTSLAMLEEYLQAYGREWERFAWLKSRVVAPRASVADGRALALRSLVTSFVYRRFLDYGVFEALRQLHGKVRDAAQRRAAGRPERANDVKLSRGGIREIEFIVQLMLIVRGGHFPEIRTRSTLKGLDRLTAGGMMKPATAARLADAYLLLRRTEHRIQFLDDQQTHLLPTNDADLEWIAQSLGFTGSNNTGELIDVLGVAREAAAVEFDALLNDGRPAGGAACKSCGPLPRAVDDDAFLATLAPEFAAKVKPLCEQPRVRLLRDESKVRLARLVTRASQAATEGRCTLPAALLFIDWLEPLLRRESYLALLAERPEVQSRLMRLLGLARWPMRYLMQHPGVIDELADQRLLHSRFDAAAYARELHERHAAWERSGQANEELLLDTLRRAHHAEVFRTLVRDVEGHITVDQVGDDLSALADATLDCALAWAWQHMKHAHRTHPHLAVIAYGKLGGKELGYGSDLDLVFVYDDEDGGSTGFSSFDPSTFDATTLTPREAPEPRDFERAGEIYAAYVRKLIGWLTMRTAAGELFDIDTALRPNGSSGLLVTSIGAFERYQSGRGSNTAWTWEHQALTRARWCAGLETLAPRIEAVRRTVLSAPRDAVALRREVEAMRAKVRQAHPVKDGRFDLKHSEGAMIDVEFAVQFLVLSQSRQHPELLDDVGNIALLQRAEAAGLLPVGVGPRAAGAYRELRRAQHRARLDEQPTQVEPASMANEKAAVLALWHAVFPA